MHVSWKQMKILQTEELQEDAAPECPVKIHGRVRRF